MFVSEKSITPITASNAYLELISMPYPAMQPREILKNVTVFLHWNVYNLFLLSIDWEYRHILHQTSFRNFILLLKYINLSRMRGRWRKRVSCIANHLNYRIEISEK